jgi:hypothetical protein
VRHAQEWWIEGRSGSADRVVRVRDRLPALRMERSTQRRLAERSSRHELPCMPGRDRPQHQRAPATNRRAAPAGRRTARAAPRLDPLCTQHALRCRLRASGRRRSALETRSMAALWRRATPALVTGADAARAPLSARELVQFQLRSPPLIVRVARAPTQVSSRTRSMVLRSASPANCDSSRADPSASMVTCGSSKQG